jgi:hypothetical protein
MPRYCSKPVEVEARQWPFIRPDGGKISERAQPFHDWLGKRFGDYWSRQHLNGRIKVSGGEVQVEPGDWVLLHGDGTVEVSKPDIFARVYKREGEANDGR